MLDELVYCSLNINLIYLMVCNIHMVNLTQIQLLQIHSVLQLS